MEHSLFGNYLDPGSVGLVYQFNYNYDHILHSQPLTGFHVIEAAYDLPVLIEGNGAAN